MRPALAEVASKGGSKSNIGDLLTLPTMVFADRSLQRQVRRAVKQEVSMRRAAIGKYGTGGEARLCISTQRSTNWPAKRAVLGDFGPVTGDDSDWGC